MGCRGAGGGTGRGDGGAVTVTRTPPVVTSTFSGGLFESKGDIERLLPARAGAMPASLAWSAEHASPPTAARGRSTIGVAPPAGLCCRRAEPALVYWTMRLTICE